MAQELLVAAVQPLRPGDEKASFTAMVPLNAKGITLLSRRSFEQKASSRFEYPLSSQFDENDAIIHFDDVKIPWDRVFVHNDVKMARAQWVEIPTLAYHSYPAQVRLDVKLRFLQENGILHLPPVQETLGQMASEVNVVQGMVAAVEATGKQYGKYFIPNESMLFSAMVYAQALYPVFIGRMRELSGGSVIGLPSSVRDLINPDAVPLIERAHGTANRTAADRSKLFSLAWDAIGSEFASRHAQYEIFYSGPAFGNRMRNFNAYDWERSTSFVESFLSTYSLPAAA